MNMIIKPGQDFFDKFRDSAEARYAVKHMAESHAALHGVWQADQYRDGKLISGGYPEPPNTFTTEGMARLLNIIFYSVSKSAALIWYVGLFSNNVTPAVGNTASSQLGAAGTYGAIQATTDMDETAYPSYTTASTATASITNSASKAEFTIANTLTLYGAFLGTASDPTDTSGYLMSAKKFTASRAVIDNDTISVAYTITLTTS